MINLKDNYERLIEAGIIKNDDPNARISNALDATFSQIV